MEKYKSELYNFRDLAGMPTLSQRKIKPGQLYRTANVSFLSPEAGRWAKEQYNISTYVDFRNDPEIKEFGKPDALIAAGVNWLNLQIDTNDDYFDRHPKPTVENWVQLYINVFEKNVDHWVKFLNQIIADEGATLFGCIFGKDRTGIAASFLMTTLDVHEEHIHRDYARTTENLVPAFRQRFLHFWKSSNLTEDEVYKHFITAHKDTMVGFVDYIQREDEKIYKALINAGFTDELQEALENKLLE